VAARKQVDIEAQITMKLESLSSCLLCGAGSLAPIDPESNIARCVNCGYIFDNPRPVLEELVDFYNRQSQYDSWLNELEPREQLWKRRLKLVLPHRKLGSLLDVGTGIGQLLSLAKPYYKETHGIEVSGTAIRIAKDKYGLELFRGTIETMVDSGKVFDNISLFHVLEHVPDPVSLLRICHSLLSERGVLIVAVPNEVTSLRASLKRSLVAAGIIKPRRGAGQFGLPRIRLTPDTSEVHLSHFNPLVLSALLRRTGFSLIEQTLDPHYVRTSKLGKLRADMYYLFCLAVRKLFGVNVYDAVLMIARKERAGEQLIAA
jgi:SAM-dependent methyltransferase